MSGFRHTPEMGEISGFGGGYEATCQDMLEAGVQWLKKRARGGFKAKLEVHGFKGVYGVLISDSEDAKRLSEIVENAATHDGKHPERAATGAMYQAVMSRLFFIAENGWETYAAECASKSEA